MKPVADGDLHRHLSKETWSKQELTTLRSWIGCLCSALAYLHANNCRHKDLKPHNILIDGDNVLLADFGTALDWTEAEGDVTTGAPEAHTRLYVAPEIALQQPRGTPSDIWSLGCVFLEMATVLSGEKVSTKTDFFRSSHTVSAAYWHNIEAMLLWLNKLSSSNLLAEEPVTNWIKNMTAIDPSHRPAATELVDMVSKACPGGMRYIRSCCSDELHSDATSWQGSVPDDEIFETALSENEMTTISSFETPTPRLDLAFSSLGLGTSSSTQAVIPSSIGIVDQQQLALQNAEPPLKAKIPASASGVVEQTYSTPRTPAMGSSAIISEPTPIRQAIDQAYEGQLSTPLDQGSSPSLNISQATQSGVSDVTTNTEFEPTTDIERAFLTNHRQLQRCLLELKKTDSGWQSQLSRLIESETRDMKGFDIFLAASNFSNTLLAKETMSVALQTKSTFVESKNIFGNSAMHFAARRGSIKVIQWLLERGAEPSVQNIHGQTPLHVALQHRQVGASKTLLSTYSSSMINLPDDQARTPLLVACVRHVPSDVVEGLISAGAIVDTRDNFKITAFQFAGTENKSLLKKQMREGDIPKVDLPTIKEQLQICKDQEAASCPCLTCRVTVATRVAGKHFHKQHIECLCPNHLRQFVEDNLTALWSLTNTLDCCPCQRCVVGRKHKESITPCGTPIWNDYSPYNDGAKYIRLSEPFSEPPRLPSSADFKYRPLPPYPGHQCYDRLIEQELQGSALSLSSQEVMTEVLKTLADAGFKGTRSYRKVPKKALRWVIEDQLSNQRIRHVRETVEVLLDCGAKIDTISPKLDCGLLSIAARNQDLHLMNFLLDKGAAVDLRSEGSWKTPLYSALVNDRALSTRMLLRAGANVNVLLPHYGTLLHRAISDYQSIGWHLPLLLAHGASTDLQNAIGWTPLDLAIDSDCIGATHTLLASGVDILGNHTDAVKPLVMAIKGGNLEMVSTILEHGADVHSKSALEFEVESPCALFMALARGHGKIVRLLVEEYFADEDATTVNRNVRGLLHKLACSPPGTLNDIVDVIFGLGLEVNAEDKWGETPLHMAAELGKIGIVKKLLEHGATTHPQNRKGETPLDLAKAWRHREVVELLGGTYKKRWWRSK